MPLEVNTNSLSKFLESSEGPLVPVGRRLGDNRPRDNHRRSKSSSSSSDELCSDVDYGRKLPPLSLPDYLPNRPQLNVPGGFAEDVQDMEDRKAAKLRRKELKKAQKEQFREEKQKAAGRSLVDDNGPPSSCRQCGKEHWSHDCPGPIPVEVSPSAVVLRETPPKDTEMVDDPGPSSTVVNTSAHPALSPLRKPSKRRATNPPGLEHNPKKSSKSKRPQFPTPTAPLSKESLSESMRTMSVSTSRSSTPLSAPTLMPKDKAPRATVRETTRKKRGVLGDGVVPSSVYGDGTFLYARLPEALRGQDKVRLRPLLDSIGKSGVIPIGDVDRAEPHDSRGWSIRCRSVEAARAAANKEFKFDGHTIKLSMYHTGGPQVFFTDHLACRDSFLIANGIARLDGLPKHCKFWMGVENVQGVAGGHMVVIFDRVPGFYSFNLPISDRKGSNAFEIRFRAVDQSLSCRVCGGTHATVSCPDLFPIRLTGQHSLSAVLDSQPVLA